MFINGSGYFTDFAENKSVITTSVFAGSSTSTGVILISSSFANNTVHAGRAFGITFFTDEAVNTGIIDIGIFTRNSDNTGVALITAIFDDFAINNGGVSGVAIFRSNSTNTGTIANSAIFTGSSVNDGVIEGDAIFAGTSISLNGAAVYGTAYIGLSANVDPNSIKGLSAAYTPPPNGYYSTGYLVDGFKDDTLTVSLPTQAVDNQLFYTYKHGVATIASGYYTNGYYINGVASSLGDTQIPIESIDSPTHYYTYTNGIATSAVAFNGYYSRGYFVNGSLFPGDDKFHQAKDDNKFYTYNSMHGNAGVGTSGYYSFGHYVSGELIAGDSTIHIAVDNGQYYIYNPTPGSVTQVNSYTSEGYYYHNALIAGDDTIHRASDDGKYYIYHPTPGSVTLVTGYYSSGYYVSGVLTAGDSTIHIAVDDSKYYTYNSTPGSVTALSGYYSNGYYVDGSTVAGDGEIHKATNNNKYYIYHPTPGSVTIVDGYLSTGYYINGVLSSGDGAEHQATDNNQYYTYNTTPGSVSILGGIILGTDNKAHFYQNGTDLGVWGIGSSYGDFVRNGAAFNLHGDMIAHEYAADGSDQGAFTGYAYNLQNDGEWHYYSNGGDAGVVRRQWEWRGDEQGGAWVMQINGSEFYRTSGAIYVNNERSTRTSNNFVFNGDWAGAEGNNYWYTYADGKITAKVDGAIYRDERWPEYATPNTIFQGYRQYISGVDMGAFTGSIYISDPAWRVHSIISGQDVGRLTGPAYNLENDSLCYFYNDGYRGSEYTGIGVNLQGDGKAHRYVVGLDQGLASGVMIGGRLNSSTNQFMQIPILYIDGADHGEADGAYYSLSDGLVHMYDRELYWWWARGVNADFSRHGTVIGTSLSQYYTGMFFNSPNSYCGSKNELGIYTGLVFNLEGDNKWYMYVNGVLDSRGINSNGYTGAYGLGDLGPLYTTYGAQTDLFGIITGVPGGTFYGHFSARDEYPCNHYLNGQLVGVVGDGYVSGEILFNVLGDNQLHYYYHGYIMDFQYDFSGRVSLYNLNGDGYWYTYINRVDRGRTIEPVYNQGGWWDGYASAQWDVSGTGVNVGKVFEMHIYNPNDSLEHYYDQNGFDTGLFTGRAYDWFTSIHALDPLVDLVYNYIEGVDMGVFSGVTEIQNRSNWYMCTNGLAVVADNVQYYNAEGDSKWHLYMGGESTLLNGYFYNLEGDHLWHVYSSGVSTGTLTGYVYNLSNDHQLHYYLYGEDKGVNYNPNIVNNSLYYEGAYLGNALSYLVWIANVDEPPQQIITVSTTLAIGNHVFSVVSNNTPGSPLEYLTHRTFVFDNNTYTVNAVGKIIDILQGASYG